MIRTALFGCCALALSSCATRPKTYSPPSSAKVDASARKLSAAVVKATDTAVRARLKVISAQQSSDKLGVISIAVLKQTKELSAKVPPELRPQAAELVALVEEQILEEGNLDGTLKTAFAEHEQLTKDLAEAKFAKLELQASQTEYQNNAQTLADAATRENSSRIKAEKSLSWYRWHWWGSWIVLGLGILACAVLAFLKFTGRLALAALILSMDFLSISCQRQQPSTVSPMPPPVRQVEPEAPSTVSVSPTPPVRHVEPEAHPRLSTVEETVAKTDKTGLQVRRWHEAKIKPSWEIPLNKAVMLYQKTWQRYQTVRNMRRDGVPPAVIFCLHLRESDNSFKDHLHEGSSLLHRTRYVPKNRLPPPDDPPYQWEKSAEDAIYVCDRLQGDWSDLEASLDRCERYNGLGYARRGVPSPYLYSGTTVYQQGKFVSDGHYSSTTVDQQLGVVAILKTFKERGIAVIPFDL